jgi:hypothetical protein
LITFYSSKAQNKTASGKSVFLNNTPFVCTVKSSNLEIYYSDGKPQAQAEVAGEMILVSISLKD